MGKYALFEERSEAEKAQIVIDALIEDFVAKYERLKTLFPKIGLGDTTTDEAVAYHFYRKLHFGE